MRSFVKREIRKNRLDSQYTMSKTKTSKEAMHKICYISTNLNLQKRSEKNMFTPSTLLPPS